MDFGRAATRTSPLTDIEAQLAPLANRYGLEIDDLDPGGAPRLDDPPHTGAPPGGGAILRICLATSDPRIVGSVTVPAAKPLNVTRPAGPQKPLRQPTASPSTLDCAAQQAHCSADGRLSP
jgi:hypothetical protein